jgi:hypothetical protein
MVDNALHCIIKCSVSPSNIKFTKFRSKGFVGHVACMGGLKNYMLHRSKKLNGRESSSLTIVRNSMEEISLGAETEMED